VIDAVVAQQPAHSHDNTKGNSNGSGPMLWSANYISAITIAQSILCLKNSLNVLNFKTSKRCDGAVMGHSSNANVKGDGSGSGPTLWSTDELQ
jgi:hypothetical protein